MQTFYIFCPLITATISNHFQYDTAIISYLRVSPVLAEFLRRHHDQLPLEGEEVLLDLRRVDETERQIVLHFRREHWFNPH